MQSSDEKGLFMKRVSAVAVFLSLSSIFLTGCGTSLPPNSGATLSTKTISGRVHGGEQPVTGSTIQLYSVGTNGDGSQATPLLSGAVTTDSNGNFNITSLYSCSSATNVYLLATGGNPGLSAPNPNLSLMTALGPCANLTPQTYIAVNELTTVAAVYALSPYMSSPTRIGSATIDAAALDGAFTLAAQLVNPSTGSVAAATMGSAASTAKINTLADIVAACINTTGGTAGGASICGHLFSLATPAAAAAPSDTITALLNIANNPTANVAQLFALAPAISPYQPTVPTLPSDFALQQTPSANQASGLQIGPPSLTFPATSVGISAPTQTVVISNPTSAPVALSSLAITGNNQADFAQANTCGATLAASATCTVAITFTPQGSATRSASLSVVSATPDSPQTVALTGNSLGLVVNGPHAVVDNPVVRIYPGASYDVTLSNTGNAPLAITSIALAGTPFNTQTNNCPASLDPGTSCVISIHSIATGADQLTIATNDPNFASRILILQALAAPTAVFTPSDVFFPGTAIGATANYTYSYNPKATVTPKISGLNAAEFTATTPVCSAGSQLQTPPSCTFTVAFKPASLGLQSAALALDGSGNYLPLAGIGTSSPQNSNNQPFLDFTYYPIPQSFTLVAPVSSIEFQTLTGPPEFTQTNNCSSVAPGASCTVTIDTTRRTEGGTQELLTVTNGNNTFTKLLDNSLYPVIDLGDTSYNSGVTGQTASYPLVNAFSGYGYSDMFETFLADEPWLDVSFAGCSSNAGACVSEVSFNPTQPGFHTGTLFVWSAGPSASFGGPSSSLNPYIVLGTGVATQPAAKLLLTQSQGSLTLTNLGPNTLNLIGPTLSGTDPQNFTLGQASCVGSNTTSSTYPSIAPGAQCTVPLTYNSTQTGFSTATATFTDTTSGLTFSTPLYLDTIVGPAVSPASLNFPNTVINTVSAGRSVTVTRDATHPVSATASGGLVATKGSCAAGETPCVLTFVFAPTAVPSSPTATVYDSTLGSSTNLSVTGTATLPVVHSSVFVSPMSLTFGAQPVGSTSAPQTVTIRSGGPDPLTIYPSTGILGQPFNSFVETSSCGSTLPPNQTCTISVSFSPTSFESNSALLYINTSASTAVPLTVSLSGSTQ